MLFLFFHQGALIYFGVRQYRNARDGNTDQQQQQNYDYPNAGTTGQVPQPPTSQPYQEPFQQPGPPAPEEVKKAEDPPAYVPPNY